jgi:hypothetical protein
MCDKIFSNYVRLFLTTCTCKQILLNVNPKIGLSIDKYGAQKISRIKIQDDTTTSLHVSKGTSELLQRVANAVKK